ncbi:STAS domain-containing protein [Actinomadura barringtoniae]|uniref:Anti-sigma factor antagonist n=1 Tax=Actinomadura barringtoniae TaxID=1427535 RepID=A0A939PIV9_9ACTN|nr:STAS domain-containing protein [Actinomadura barringtoniae]MBO2450888.1 STAS domain-containing protein [Actinomadura barringtoniae]
MRRNLLTVLAQEHDRFTVITLSGELDLSTADLVRPHLDSAKGRPAHLVFDLTQLEFMDSSGLHLLARAYSITRAQGAVVVMVAPADRIHRVLEVAGFTREMAVYPTLELALATLR